MKKEKTMKNFFSLEEHFFLSDSDLEKILNTALAQGGDFAEAYFEYRISSSIIMEEDIIKETSKSISLGLGIRVLEGDQTGYAYTNDLGWENIRRAALTAGSIAGGKAAGSARPLQTHPLPAEVYRALEPSHAASLEEKISLVKRAYRAGLAFDGKIKKVHVSFADQIRRILVVNSSGLKISDTQPLLKLACRCIAEKAGKRESGYSGGGGRMGLEYFDKNLSPEDIAHDAAVEALLLLEAVPAPAGEMPVVLAPGHSGVLIHEAVGHLLEADFNRKKTSVFWDKMGHQVASEPVNIYDDPTIPCFRGSYNIDDEGTVPRKTALVRHGKLVGLLQDRLSASLMAAPLTGHGRRQDYSCIPLPRMSNTYIDGGEHDPEEIIRSVSRGFYAHKFQGGQVEDSGKFTFSVNSGFLIEGGKRGRPAKQATLIGSNIDILHKIERVGSDLAFGLQTGTCGKEGQAVPVTDGCPTLKITKMTVGGRRT